MATVPTFITWVAGSVLTAAQLNSTARDGGNFWLTVKPACRVRQTVVQSIPNSAYTAITYDAEDYDNDGMHSTSTNTSRITCVTPGRYIIVAADSVAVSATGIRIIQVRTTLAASGTRVGASLLVPAQGTTNADLSTAWSDYLFAGDYFEAILFQNSGGALNTVPSSNNTSLASCSVYWFHNA